MDIHTSIIIPVKNEEESIGPLIEEVEAVMKGSGWELIVVNDGSTDRSGQRVVDLLKEKPFLRLISFTRNFGQSAAFAAGFARARGSIVVTLDGDGQNNPADIPKLLSLIEGADLVVGWRKERRDPWQKRVISKFSNGIRSRLCQDGVHDSGCSLKVYRKSALDTLPRFRGMHRFLPALFLIAGYRIKEVPVSHRMRLKGKTKYHFFNRLVGPISDLFFVLWMRKKWLAYQIDEGRSQ